MFENKYLTLLNNVSWPLIEFYQKKHNVDLFKLARAFGRYMKIATILLVLGLASMITIGLIGQITVSAPKLLNIPVSYLLFASAGIFFVGFGFLLLASTKTEKLQSFNQEVNFFLPQNSSPETSYMLDSDLIKSSHLRKAFRIRLTERSRDLFSKEETTKNIPGFIDDLTQEIKRWDELLEEGIRRQANFGLSFTRGQIFDIVRSFLDGATKST